MTITRVIRQSPHGTAEPPPHDPRAPGPIPKRGNVALELVPIDLLTANDFVRRLHRHSKPTVSHKLSVGVQRDGALRGVAIAGRPVSRALDDGWTIEIYRVCTDGTRNACSKLYAACCTSARGQGYRKAITYTLDSEPGSSLRAAGFGPVAEVTDRQWDCPSRPREERDLIGGKVRWERAL